MLSLARNGYTHDQVKAVLHLAAGSRELQFKYDLLDYNNRFIRTLDNVVDGEVTLKSLASIKRTATFTLRDDQSIDYLNHRIRPTVLLKMPSGKEIKEKFFFLRPTFPTIFKEIEQMEEGWVEFPQGIFLLSSPTRSDENIGVYRNIDAYDQSLILRDDKFESRYAVRRGRDYRQAVIEILESAGITDHEIDPIVKRVPSTREYEPGASKLTVVNNLLSAINYTPIYVDADGVFRSRPYRSPSERAAEYTYKDDDLSVTFKGMEEELDTFNVPNRWVAVLSDPERDPLVASYTNDNPDSITSTVNRNRTIVDYREVEDIADQYELNKYVRRIADNASQIYGKLYFNTALMPHHDYSNVLQIEYSPLNVKDKYSETSWTMPLKAGASMKHEVRRVVNI